MLYEQSSIQKVLAQDVNRVFKFISNKQMSGWSKYHKIFMQIELFDCVGAAMVPISWCEMQCPKTRAKEHRKVAKVQQAS